MIRPITCVCFLLACGSGLYVYQSKHRVQVLDRRIEKTVRATDALREQTRALHAEWTLLNDPQRLQLLADQFLSLKTVTPGQFTSMADLGNRLPAIGAPEPVAEEMPVAESPAPTQPEELRTPTAVAVAPSPAKAVGVAAVSSPPRVADHKLLSQSPPHPAVAEAAPVRPPSPVVRPVVAALPPRPSPPRVIPAASPAPAAGPTAGSALGMARSAAVPPPQPMPVSASQWVSNNGGGG